MWCLRRPAGYLMNSSQQNYCTHFEVAIYLKNNEQIYFI